MNENIPGNGYLDDSSSSPDRPSLNPDVFEDTSLPVLLVVLAMIVSVSIILCICEFTSQDYRKDVDIDDEDCYYFDCTIATEHEKCGCRQSNGSTKAASTEDEKLEASFDASRYESDNGSKDTSALVCSICLESFAPGEAVAWSPECRHVFHQECLHEWIKKRRQCPYCRTPMITRNECKGAMCSRGFCIEHGLVQEEVTDKPASCISIRMGNDAVVGSTFRDISK